MFVKHKNNFENIQKKKTKHFKTLNMGILLFTIKIQVE